MPLSRPHIAVPLSRAPTPRRAARLRAVVAVLLLAASFARAQLLADADALIKRGHSAEATQNYDRAAQQGDAEVQFSVAVMYLADAGEMQKKSGDGAPAADPPAASAHTPVLPRMPPGSSMRAHSTAQDNEKARKAVRQLGEQP